MYAPGEYDLAGFAVGVVARKKIVDGARVAEGDVALGLPSSGLHSNGYSLARKALLEVMKLSPGDRPAGAAAARRVGEALLAPTRLYARHVAGAARGGRRRARDEPHHGRRPARQPAARAARGARAAHRARAGRARPSSTLIQRRAGVEEREMRRTFNLGVGFVVVVPARRGVARDRGAPRARRGARSRSARSSRRRPTGRSRSAWSGRRDHARGARLRQRDQPAGDPRRHRRRHARRTGRRRRLERPGRRRARARARGRRRDASSSTTGSTPTGAPSTPPSSRSCARAASRSSSWRGSCAC